MKAIIIVIVSTVFFFKGGLCTEDHANHSDDLIYGNNPDSVPQEIAKHLVAVWKHAEEPKTNTFICSGALITSIIVATLRKCAEDDLFGYLYVVAGTTSLDGSGNTGQSERVESYRNVSPHVAFLKLKHPIVESERISRIKISTFVTPGKEGVLIGYPHPENSGNTNVQKKVLDIKDQDECPNREPLNLCVSQPWYGQDTCAFENGAILLQHDEDEGFVVAGFLHLGSDECDRDQLPKFIDASSIWPTI